MPTQPNSRYRPRFSPVAFALSLALTCGCALRLRPSGEARSSSDTAASSEAEAAAIGQALKSAEARKSGYQLAPKDIIEVTVYEEDDLHKTVEIGDDGLINLPIVGQVRVSGLTAAQVEATLRRLLGDYLVSPQVSVQIKEYHARKFFVLGEVAKAGSFDLPRGRAMTALEAIASAGGLMKTAAAARTRVLRRIDGNVTSIPVPIPEILAGDKGKDVHVLPDDVIYVPQRAF
ncbi:MAG: polysaccharide export protein [Elusimicrobia bacterium]|nr:polysaccharide export protein [Elusimicrobiota bacterium]